MSNPAYRHPDYRRAKKRLEGGGGVCWRCGSPASQIDHVTPLALGGGVTTDNLAPICGPCNRRTGGKLGARLRRRSRTTRNRRY